MPASSQTTQARAVETTLTAATEVAAAEALAWAMPVTPKSRPAVTAMAAVSEERRAAMVWLMVGSGWSWFVDGRTFGRLVDVRELVATWRSRGPTDCREGRQAGGG